MNKEQKNESMKFGIMLLHDNFINELKKICTLYGNVQCRISTANIELFTVTDGKIDFNSNFDIRAKDNFFQTPKDNSISVPSCSSFNLENKDAVNRYLNVASVLSNLDKVFDLVNYYCKQVEDRHKELHNEMLKTS